jgi:hypothetical protein
MVLTEICTIAFFVQGIVSKLGFLCCHNVSNNVQVCESSVTCWKRVWEVCRLRTVFGATVLTEVRLCILKSFQENSRQINT